VLVAVPQDKAPEILARAKQGTIPVAALDRTRAETLATGTFSTLDNQVDPTTGTVRAKARFANADGALFPNQFVNVRLTLQTLHDALVVPLPALRTGPDGDFVWIVRPDQTVTMRQVKRGQTTPTQAVILSGLSQGERVVTEGGDRLTEGGRILLPGQTRGRRGAGGGAEPAAAPTAGAAGGGSPQMRAQRAALRQACAADLAKLCPGQEGREAFVCLREKADQASAGCKAAFAKAPRRGGGQPGRDGGAGPG
jgi:multidrug efflux system membrane fusion protein